MLEPIYKKLIDILKNRIPINRLLYDELTNIAYGTDASFYRLTPKIVIKVISEEEVILVIKSCNELNIPITFRASGTSLSGQSISDSVLLIVDRSWNKIKISEDKQKITLQPSVIGGRANLELNQFNKKIGPDPASINAATITGIASNNASGMTSGVKFNTYNTVADMRIVFANGNVLNTSDPIQKTKFIEENRELVVDLLNIAWEINKDPTISKRIAHKYEIKNTTGYSINSFIDFKDPIEIIKHLMIGSEGTLGFISEITLNTVQTFPNKATSLVLFPNIEKACKSIPILNSLPIDAAELMDRAALRSVENKEGLPDYIKTLDDDVAALLIETSAESSSLLQQNIELIEENISIFNTVLPIQFTTDKKEYIKLWNVRKGLFPSVSKARKPGTTVIIEDVNFRTKDLGNAVTDLRNLFIKHGYYDTIIWGHALSGNIHFVFAQDFNKEYEVKRYQKFMNDVVELVIEKYDGSLKAEHGTGRNMAPFVKYEWGDKIYEYMCTIKKIFDSKNILNPGVLINFDDEIHIKNLKPTPEVNPIIDKCIDCGFCENVCPSKNLTLTPRQRITVWREISKLKQENNDSSLLLKLEQGYNYFGDQTCATDGLCELACPVDIDTGKLIKKLRNRNLSQLQIAISIWIANHFLFTTKSAKFGLNFISFVFSIFGEKALLNISKLLRKLSKNKIPLWNRYLPKGSKFSIPKGKVMEMENNVVYFPSCISRTMGNFKNSKFNEEQTTVIQRLLKKSNYNIIYPKNLNSLCCGMPFSSKGFFDEADQKAEELYNSLLEASNNGEIPILFDTSPCVKTIKECLVRRKDSLLRIYDSVEFIHDYLLDKLLITKKDETITIHSTCSSTKMNLDEKLLSIAKKCAKEVYVPQGVTCCGFAGDRGFTYPELNKSALEGLEQELKKQKCTSAYSTSKTCEIGLSLHGGIEYNSIAYLVDECSKSKSDSNNKN